MFEVNENNIREAYGLLDVLTNGPVLKGWKASPYVVDLKRAIRAYNNRPAPDDKRFKIDTVLEVWGCVEVEAESYREALDKVMTNPKKFGNLAIWNDGVESELRVYDRFGHALSHELGDIVGDLHKARKEVHEE